LQMFGDVTVWPKAETFFFTSDVTEGGKFDQSIEIRFADGSLCNLSGTLRIQLPTSPEQAIALATERGHKTYKDLEQKLILPTVRNVLRLTANMMTAEESYSSKRTDFIFAATDQIKNGLYQTTDDLRKIKDLVSGEMVTKTFKVIKTDTNGNPLYQQNPLKDTGITLRNFEVKRFVYEDKVKKQIAAQQEARMAVATAKAKAQEAEQDKLTIEAQGKAKVARAKYEKEQEKVRAVVDAEKDKAVAETQATQRLNVAKLDRQAAEQTKQKEILLGQGESERKRLVISADGALTQKLATYERVVGTWADAYSKRHVPAYVVSGGDGKGTDTDMASNQFMNWMNMSIAKSFGLDLSIRQK